MLQCSFCCEAPEMCSAQWNITWLHHHLGWAANVWIFIFGWTYALKTCHHWKKMHLILTAADVRHEADDRLVLLPKALSEWERQQKAQIVNVNVIYVLSCVCVSVCEWCKECALKFPLPAPPSSLLCVGLASPSRLWYGGQRGASHVPLTGITLMVI